MTVRQLALTITLAIPSLWAGWAIPVRGQTAQTVSLQVSSLGSYPFGGGLEVVSAGFGWEAQARWNPSQLSFGFGGDQTFHHVIGADDRDITATGGFFEPRYVIYRGWGWAAPYISGRVALSQIHVDFGAFERTATGFTLNGGGGLLVRLADRFNVDVGATVGFRGLGRVTFPSSGLRTLGTGGNVVGRVGLAAGVG